MTLKMEESVKVESVPYTTPDPGEEVVISGIAGKFPESDNMRILQKNLFDKVDLVTDDDRRWTADLKEIPHRMGKVNNISKFDTVFFGIHPEQAQAMDPVARILMEQAYEAVIDAGVNPKELRGTKTAVIAGCSFIETEQMVVYEKPQDDKELRFLDDAMHTIGLNNLLTDHRRRARSGWNTTVEVPDGSNLFYRLYDWHARDLQIAQRLIIMPRGLGLIGCSRSLLSNRIAYWLGVHGPSYTVDTACSTALVAIEQAYTLMRIGKCDAAIVATGNLCLYPQISLQFARLGVLSTDGRCKSFDADANGYVRSDAVVVIFLQKKKDAKRIYATVVHGLSNCDGFKEQGMTFPSSKLQSTLFKDCYDQCGLSPSVLSFLEAHATGTKVGDPEEIDAIGNVFCEGRTTPLKIGSVKSNLGHTEASCGLCSVAKIIIAMETGFIPPNLYYKKPRETMKALIEGKLEVVTDVTPWNGGYAGINSFAVGGVNCHVVLKSNSKEKINGGAPTDELPRLVVASGRTKEAVLTILQDVESRSIDVEYIRLLHDIHSDEIQGHVYRGYTVVGSKLDEAPSGVEEYSGSKRPICFVFSGMGSQWPSMGEALLKFPVFARAIGKCDTTLKTHGLDIYNILKNTNTKIFDDILSSFVGIVAVQIGLVDLLTCVGIVPDNMIGHSVGELACAYADGCFTAEQTITAAYYRGLACKESQLEQGSMAAVGRGYNEIKDICPSDIVVACHNSTRSCTISGPTNSIKAFVAHLQENDIFAKEVPTSNIAFHSPYIKPASPKLLNYLKQVIPHPNPRSTKWISTSVPHSAWSSPIAKYSSAEYHTNNLLNPVLFEEGIALIPEDAIVIEVAPHGLLQAILRRSMPSTTLNVPLTRRDHKDNAEMVLGALGKLYSAGLQPQLANLYPPVEYPVSRGTPMISPLIRWDYSEEWSTHLYNKHQNLGSGEREVTITLRSENFENLTGHVLDGRNIMPGSEYLTLVWETFAIMNGNEYLEMSVVFENVKFHRTIILRENYDVKLFVVIQQGTGKFEITEKGIPVVTGQIRRLDESSQERVINEVLESSNQPDKNSTDDKWMETKDIYKELNLRGFQYGDSFRRLKRMSIDGTKGQIDWVKDWIIYLDNVLQLRVLAHDTRDVFLLTSIQKLIIDTKYHKSCLIDVGNGKKEVPVRFYRKWNTLVSGGVEIRGIETTTMTKKAFTRHPVVETYKFVAYCDNTEVSLEEVIRLSAHLVVENNPTIIRTRVVEFVDNCDKVSAQDLASGYVVKALDDLPLVQPDVTLVMKANEYTDTTLPEKITTTQMDKFKFDGEYLFSICYGLMEKSEDEHLQTLLSSIKDGSFVLTRENTPVTINRELLQTHSLHVVLQKQTKNETFVLLRKVEKLPKHVHVVSLNNNEFSWLEKIQSILLTEAENRTIGKSRIAVVVENDFDSGILGFVNCLRKEPGGETVVGVFIQDSNAPRFSLENPLYAEQLKMNLAINILQPGNIWGSYRRLPLPPTQPKLVTHAYIDQAIRGDLSSVRWLEGPLNSNSMKSNLVHVMYSSMNTKDVMISTGTLAIKDVDANRWEEGGNLGSEYSGYDDKGCAVMGVTTKHGFSNIVQSEKCMTWPVPKEWTLEDAATVPHAYATSYYALCLAGKMKKGDKILIHAGSGSVGQAAIHLALHEGCEIFTTVGSLEERKFIRETFSSIDEDHIGNSQNTSFEQMILKETNGRGVDIILNSLTEDKLQASLRCLAPKGRFLEIGNVELASNNYLGMDIFFKEISFQRVVLKNLFIADTNEKMQLQQLFLNGLHSGAIKPLSRRVFGKDEVESALRYMAAGKYIGKVVLQIHKDKAEVDAPILAQPRFYCQPNRCYVIVGGLGGFGVEFVDWLVLRGAKHLVLVSRNGVQNGYQRARTELWKSYGTEVSIITGLDLSSKKDCEFLLKSAEKMAPVGGIFNVAVVLQDRIFTNQTPDTFAETFIPKAWATDRLDTVSRKLCPKLEHFVVFSSVSSSRGNAGQTNYCMSNSVMERICERRVQEGLPGLAIQWSSIGQVGLLTKIAKDDKVIVIGGQLPQNISSCLLQLDKFLLQSLPIVASTVLAEKNTDGVDLSSIANTVAHIIGLKDLKTVSQQKVLAELGVDSVMTVEVQQALEKNFGVLLSAKDIRNLTFAKLLDMNKVTSYNTGGDQQQSAVAGSSTDRAKNL